jgi:predicted DsbA family dithiol-disulfide isomerase
LKETQEGLFMVSTSTTGTTPRIVADYFTDILCVWAYAGQVRIDELEKHYGDRIELRYRFLPLFGDVRGRVQREWGDRGGLPAYADHVQRLAASWNHVGVHPEVWRRNVQASSCGIHRFLKAVELCTADDAQGERVIGEGQSILERVVKQLRKAFFEEALDIGRREYQDSVAKDFHLAVEAVRELTDNGKADARLSADLELKEALQIPGSPTLVLNEGRQWLYGNIGYRVIDANIRELLRDAQYGEASWC